MTSDNRCMEYKHGRFENRIDFVTNRAVMTFVAIASFFYIFLRFFLSKTFNLCDNVTWASRFTTFCLVDASFKYEINFCGQIGGVLPGLSKRLAVIPYTNSKHFMPWFTCLTLKWSGTSAANTHPWPWSRDGGILANPTTMPKLRASTKSLHISICSHSVRLLCALKFDE